MATPGWGSGDWTPAPPTPEEYAAMGYHQVLRDVPNISWDGSSSGTMQALVWEPRPLMPWEQAIQEGQTGAKTDPNNYEYWNGMWLDKTATPDWTVGLGRWGEGMQDISYESTLKQMAKQLGWNPTDYDLGKAMLGFHGWMAEQKAQVSPNTSDALIIQEVLRNLGQQNNWDMSKFNALVNTPDWQNYVQQSAQQAGQRQTEYNKASANPMPWPVKIIAALTGGLMGGGLLSGLDLAPSLSGVLGGGTGTAAELPAGLGEALAGGWEGAVATSSLQNAALAAGMAPEAIAGLSDAALASILGISNVAGAAPELAQALSPENVASNVISPDTISPDLGEQLAQGWEGATTDTSWQNQLLGQGFTPEDLAGLSAEQMQSLAGVDWNQLGQQWEQAAAEAQTPPVGSSLPNINASDLAKKAAIEAAKRLLGGAGTTGTGTAGTTGVAGTRPVGPSYQIGGGVPAGASYKIGMGSPAETPIPYTKLSGTNLGSYEKQLASILGGASQIPTKTTDPTQTALMNALSQYSNWV